MNAAHMLRLQASRLRGEVTLGWLTRQGGSVFPGWLIVLAAAPSLLPIPGVGNITGCALLALAVSIWRGHHPLELPARVQAWRLSPASAGRLLRTLARLHESAARYLKPRAPSWVGTRAWTWTAWPVAAMGVVIFLPIPLGNVFGAVALVVLGLGHSMEDGLAVAFGWALSGLTLLYTLALTWGLGVLGHQLWQAAARWMGFAS
ncbi:MAG: hypothetical protein RL584_2187 [Pseudomonadota bacterium]|jgi:hypothetical protein